MFTQQIKDIAQSIGQFYLLKNNRDVIKASQEVQGLVITQLEVIDKYNLVIETYRPGLLIGRRGTNIAELQKFITERHPEIHKLSIHEANDCLWNYLNPIDYEQEMEYNSEAEKKAMSTYLNDLE